MRNTLRIIFKYTMIILCSTYFYNSYLYYRRVEKPEEKWLYNSIQYNFAKKCFSFWRMLYAVSY